MWKNCFICERFKNRKENSQCINGYRTPILLYYYFPSANPKLTFITTDQFYTKRFTLPTSNKTISLITRKYEFALSSEPPRVAIAKKYSLAYRSHFSPFK